MTAIKIAIAAACSLLLLLGMLIVFAQNPEQKLFDETVELLMERECLASSSEVMRRHPELKNIELKMERINQLKTTTQRLTGGPAPNPSMQEQEKAAMNRQIIKQLQSEIQTALLQLAELQMTASH
ncbi:MAG: hypothetical protein AAGI23_01120 [Bacteroidota bacterium]